MEGIKDIIGCAMTLSMFHRSQILNRLGAGARADHDHRMTVKGISLRPLHDVHVIHPEPAMRYGLM